MERDPLSTLLRAALAKMMLLMPSHLLCSTRTLSAAAKPSIHNTAGLPFALSRSLSCKSSTMSAACHVPRCLRFAALAHLRAGSDKREDIAAPAGHQMLSWTA